MRADFPFPETLPALALQLQLLRHGRKRLVLLPHGVVPPDSLHGLHLRETHRGTFAAADPDELMNLDYALAHDLIGLPLGYGIGAKPEQPDRAITLRDGAGREVLTVMADPATAPAVHAALRQLGDETCTVAEANPFAVLRERAAWWLHFFDSLQPETSPDHE